MQFSTAMLPADHGAATLVGRLLLDDGPTPVVIRNGVVEDVSRSAATVADLMDLAAPGAVRGEDLFGIEALVGIATERFLAPVDRQAVKAAGVTFAISAIERVIE